MIGGTADVNYGDFSKTYKPSASFLFSDRWQTGLGEMGFLVDVAHSELATRSDGVQVEPYVRRTDAAVLAGSGRDEVFVPGGVNWRQLDFSRKRDGVGAAFQWRPSDATEIYVQYLRSRYEMDWQERAAFFNDTSNNITPAAGTTFRYDDNGVFVGGSPVSSSWRGTLTSDGVRFNTDNRYSAQSTTTSDLSAGFRHYLNDHLVLKGDLQLVQSDSDALDFTVFSATYLPGLSYDLSGTYPRVAIATRTLPPIRRTTSGPRRWTTWPATAAASWRPAPTWNTPSRTAAGCASPASACAPPTAPRPTRTPATTGA